MTILSMKHLSLRRGEKQILSDINWEVQTGEHWAILGLNGSGKSSLVKLILAELWKTSGELEVLGTSFGKDAIFPLRQKVSIVSSFIAERFSAQIHAENLVYTGKFNASMLYKPYTDAELDSARTLMRQIGAETLIGRQYGGLSQGEKQLLLIARSLILKPEILILDEATNGLDLFAKEKFLSHLHQIVSLPSAPTLLYISHHPDEIGEDFSHVLLLREGKIVAAGEKAHVLTEAILTDFYQRPVAIQSFGNRYFVTPK